MLGQQFRCGGGGGGDAPTRGQILLWFLATCVSQPEKGLRRAARPSVMSLETVRPHARRNGCREVPLVTKDAGAAVKVTHARSNPQALYRIRSKPDGDGAVLVGWDARIFERPQRGASPHWHAWTSGVSGREMRRATNTAYSCQHTVAEGCGAPSRTTGRRGIRISVLSS